MADAFQDVFTIVWRNLDLLSEPAALPGWISTIARREAWRTARRRSRTAEQERRVAADPAGSGLPWQSPPADDASERAERAALVRHAVDRLDGRCRDMLTMLFWEEPTPPYDEVAERLGMPLGSLGPTRGRCLEKLRERLEEGGF
jgi:RNA polymerase sigma factor (sigma-70 family)